MRPLCYIQRCLSTNDVMPQRYVAVFATLETNTLAKLRNDAFTLTLEGCERSGRCAWRLPPKSRGAIQLRSLCSVET